MHTETLDPEHQRVGYDLQPAYSTKTDTGYGK